MAAENPIPQPEPDGNNEYPFPEDADTYEVAFLRAMVDFVLNAPDPWGNDIYSANEQEPPADQPTTKP